MKRPTTLFAATLLALVCSTAPGAQQDDPDPEPEPFTAEGIPAVPFPDGPREYDTASGQRIRVAVVTEGLTYPGA